MVYGLVPLQHCHEEALCAARPCGRCDGLDGNPAGVCWPLEAGHVMRPLPCAHCSSEGRTEGPSVPVVDFRFFGNSEWSARKLITSHHLELEIQSTFIEDLFIL